ncbi:uncharacterized protein LOC144443022 [Glandiceps talaboti]
MFKLTMSDCSGQLDVLVARQHADTLFSDHMPDNLYCNMDKKFLLEDYIYALCPYPLHSLSPNDNSDVDSDSRPWLECCIMSYDIKVHGKNVTKYQMFDTTMALNIES